MVLTKDFMWFYQQQLAAARAAQEQDKTPAEIAVMHAEAKKNGVDVNIDYTTLNRSQRREMEKVMKRNNRKSKPNADPKPDILDETKVQLEQLAEILKSHDDNDGNNEIMEGTVE